MDADNQDLPSSEAAVNKAGRLYDPATGKLLKQNQVQEPVEQAQVQQPTQQAQQPPAPSPLVELARKLGVSETTIASIPETSLAALVRDLYNAHEQRLNQQQFNQPIQPVVQQAQVDPDADLDDLGLNAENCTPEVIAAFKKLTGKVKQKASRSDTDKLSLAQQKVWVEQEFDRFFAQHPDTFGHGPTAAVDPFSEQGIKRRLIRERCDGNPRKTTPYQDAQNVFAMSGWGQAVKPRISEEQWNSAGLGQPQHRRTTANLSDRDQRIASYTAQLRANGEYVPHDTGPTNDDLPD